MPQAAVATHNRVSHTIVNRYDMYRQRKRVNSFWQTVYGNGDDCRHEVVAGSGINDTDMGTHSGLSVAKVPDN